MASTQHKPVPNSSPAVVRPVADARARALQEQIRGLREQVLEAGDRLLQANDRNRESLLRAWEQADQACRQAEREMARLRARSLGAAAPENHPANPASQGRPDPDSIDPDQCCDRRQSALAALNLLERAAQPLLRNSPILEQGLVQATDTETVTATSIDFGPLVEDAAAPATAATPAAISIPERTTPVVEAPAPAPNPFGDQTAAAPHPQPGRPATHNRNTGTAQPARKPAPGRRSRFGVALLAGILLGAGCVLAAAAWLGNPQTDLRMQIQQLPQAGLDALQALQHRVSGRQD
jgi:hypothetical protein